MFNDEIKLKRNVSQELLISLLSQNDLLHFSLGVIISKLVEQGKKKDILLKDISDLFDYSVNLKKES